MTGLKSLKILIRCDATSKIGTGHLMRSLVLAGRFREDEVAFATRVLEGDLHSLIKKSGYKCHTLQNNKVKTLLKLLKKEKTDLLIIDHYDLDMAFERELKETLPHLKIMVLDDTYEKHYCDILLNHNIYAKKKHYKDLVPKGTLLLCGEKYTLLRDEFLETSKSDKRDSILIAMGGSDLKNHTLKILHSLPKEFSLQIHIITTAANKNIQALQKYVKEKKNITLHIQTQEVAKLALRAHFAIITPSGFANELYALQTPFIAIQSAKNQEYMSAFLEKKGYGVLKKFSQKAFLKLFEAEMQKAGL